LTQARQRVPCLSIVLTAGNHDSPGRLEAPAPFLSLLDAHVIGHVPRSPEGIDLDRLVLPLKDHTRQVAAWCIAMPFLRPGDVPQVEGAQDPYMAGMAEIYAQAYELACQKRASGQAIVAMGHCHVTGGQVSEESERRIVIGGSEALSASVFAPGVAYVALGHLHLAQKLGGDATRRYCGSPLPMSFSEVDYPHQVVIVELEGDVVLSTRDIRIPRSVALLRVPRQPAPLAQVLAELQALSLPPDLPPAQWPFLLVRVQLSAPEPGLRALVEAALADKPVRLVRIETRSANSAQVEAAALVSVDELSNLAPAGFFERLYQHRFGEVPPPELMAAFTELVNQSPEAGGQS
jgi:exonuclease SbcD